MSRMAEVAAEMQREQEEQISNAQWAEANVELEIELESICRDYLTRGGAVEDVQFLASQLGISYERITGGG